MTPATLAVLYVLLANPTEELYGLKISDAAGLKSGTIHPILARFEALGWLVSRWEDVDPRRAGRPKRRLYKLSEEGAAGARTAISKAEAEAKKRSSQLLPGRLVGGAA